MPVASGKFWFASRGIAATPGHFWSSAPWSGTKTNTGWATRTQASTHLGGGLLDTDNTNQNNLFTADHWLDDGTYKFALVLTKDSNHGIHNITGINGTQTIDAYDAATQTNQYAEVTGITVTAGLKTVQDSMATKNASSSAYAGRINTYAIVRTGA